MLHFNEQLRLDINTQTSPCNDVVEQPQTPNHYHIKDSSNNVWHVYDPQVPDLNLCSI